MAFPAVATAALPQAGGTTVILGGGLSGLCSAFYLSRLYQQQQQQSSLAVKRKIVLLEKSDRFGGWVRSCTATSSSSSSNSSLKGKEREVIGEEVEFEAGPRSVRPVGLPGLLTLDLVCLHTLQAYLVYLTPDCTTSQRSTNWAWKNL